MEAWLRLILSVAPSSIASFARGVGDRLVSLYTWVNTALTKARTGWGTIATWIPHLRGAINNIVKEILTTIRWLLTVWIPGRISTAINNLRRLLTQAIDAARRELGALVATLRQWAIARVSDLTNALSTFRKWISERVDATIATLTRVRDIVYALLTSPQRLASWLVGAMVNELWTYANRNSDRIAIWVRRRSVAYTVEIVKQIEHIIARLI